MEENESPDADYQLLFVQPIEICFDALSPTLKLAFKCMDDRKFDPIWVEDRECYDVKKRDASKIYVCDPFEGKLYNHLVATQSRVVGPQCILNCITNNQPIPRIPNPLYSLVMKNVILTCTNMDRKQKDYIEKKAQLLGGIMSKALVPSVTHLVTNDVGSKKYFVAGNINLPLVLPSWIDDCWDRSKSGEFDCNDKNLLEKHKCPIFKGCTITVSQISSSERTKLSEIIQKNGGIYNGNLECHKTTHLVLSEPTGKKYISAKKWKVHCITPQWIYDSAKKGYCIDWSLYSVNESTQCSTASTSTPEKNKTGLPRISSGISKLEFSQIEPVGGMSNVDETYMTEFEMSMLKENRSKPTNPVNSLAANLNYKSLEELDSIDLQKIKMHGLFLDGCKLYLSGFSGPRLDKLLRIINFGGGFRFSQLCENVTHIIVNGNKSSDILKNINHDPHIVNLKWLMDCCKDGCIVSEEPYLINKVKPQTASFSPMNIKMNKINESKVKEVEENSKKEEFNVPKDIDNVLSQYMTPKITNPTVVDNDDVTIVKNEVEKEDVDEEQLSNGVFNDIKMHITPFFTNEDHEFLVDIIETRGGIVVGASDSYKYAIVPLEVSQEVDDLKGDVVTSTWIEYCASEEHLFNPIDNVVFVPLKAELVKKMPLKNCVVTLSIYSGVERESLMELACALGATCQDMFLRVPKGDSSANTHLVISEGNGNKYSAARRWNIPAVTKQWLIDTVKLGEKPEEKWYDVDEPQPNPKILIDSDEQIEKHESEPEEEIIMIEEFNRPTSSAADQASPNNFQSPKEVQSKGELPNLDKFDTPDITPISRRKSRVETLRKSSGGDSIRSRLSMNGTPAKYLDLSAMSAAFDSPNAEKSTPKRNSDQTFQSECNRYVKLALENCNDNQKEETDHVELDGRPLAGIIIVVSKRLAKTQGELNNLAAYLGADYRWSYDDCCTHLIHQGKQTDISRDIKKAKSQGKFIVSPAWLTACKEENCRVDEALYPFTYNPKMNLSSQVTSKKLSISPNKTSAQASSPSEENRVENTSRGEENELYKKLDSLMSASKSDSSRKLRQRKSNASRSSTAGLNSASDKIEKAEIYECPSESVPTESQGVGPITWEDPTSRNEREKIAEILAQQGTQESESVNYEVHSMKSDNIMTKPAPKIFLLTGFPDEDKLGFGNKIEALNGKFLDCENFDAAATHLIAFKPSKSEKFLASMAAGLYILRPNYIEDSTAGGKFLLEDDYEWGSEETLAESDIPAQAKKLAQAATCWRSLLSKSSQSCKGAFHDWKVIFNIGGGDKEFKLTRLLRAGLAEILDLKPPYSGTLHGATHAFIEVSKRRDLNVDWDNLSDNRVKCLRVDYIASYLRDGISVNANNFRLETSGMKSNKRKSDDNQDVFKKYRKM